MWTKLPFVAMYKWGANGPLQTLPDQSTYKAIVFVITLTANYECRQKSFSDNDTMNVSSRFLALIALLTAVAATKASAELRYETGDGGYMLLYGQFDPAHLSF